VARKTPGTEAIRPQAQERRERFVAEYLIDRNATQAAIRAGYSERTAYSQGCRLLKDAEVRRLIEESSANLRERLQLTTEQIAEHLANVITADPNDLIEYRRECCRYCWGDDFRYQRTPQEMRDARRNWEEGLLAKNIPPEQWPEFDEQGGIGFNKLHAPNPECPECFGEGVDRPYPKDTRSLGPAAAALYAGVKVTKDGLEIKMHSKEKAVELYGKHLGMFVDKHELSGPGGKEQAAPQYIVAPIQPAKPSEE